MSLLLNYVTDFLTQKHICTYIHILNYIQCGVCVCLTSYKLVTEVRHLPSTGDGQHGRQKFAS